jgi:hypothetical protein
MHPFASACKIHQSVNQIANPSTKSPIHQPNHHVTLDQIGIMAKNSKIARPLAFLCIPTPFSFLSPLPYSRKAVLFVPIIPGAQEACGLVSTISHFGLFVFFWTLKKSASLFFLDFGSKNLMKCLYLHHNRCHEPSALLQRAPGLIGQYQLRVKDV